jgi:hypothetical protein
MYRPVYVVAANDPKDKSIYIITVYEPDRAEWDVSFSKRVTP